MKPVFIFLIGCTTIVLFIALLETPGSDNFMKLISNGRRLIVLIAILIVLLIAGGLTR